MSNFKAVMELMKQQDAQPKETKTKTNGQGDADIKTMLDEFDLLSLIQSNTGEAGHQSGDRIDFHECPICGHRDCFSYYPSTKSWSCFGASNTSGYEGGTALEYFKATMQLTDAEAVKRLRDETGHPYEFKDKTQDATNDKDDGATLRLPPWSAIRATEPPKRNPVLISGILRRGHVALLAAKGKSGKSWSAIQLAIAVATGGEWFGCRCERGDVLFIDPELDFKSLDNRFSEVCRAMGVEAAEVDAHVAKWSLRGVEGATMDNIVHDLRMRCEQGSFALVVLDSSSVFVEGDENSSRDIRVFSSKVLRIAAITGASVLLVHHYGKGGAGDKDTADRARGSSVWLDFPDATLFLTEVFPTKGEPSAYLRDGERAFILETGGLREFPAMEPKRLIYSFPIHHVDVDGITQDWKPKSARGTGAKKANELKAAETATKNAKAAAALLAHYYANGIDGDGLVLKDAGEAIGLDSRQLKSALAGCEYFEIVQVSARKSFVRAKVAPKLQQQKLLSD